MVENVTVSGKPETFETTALKVVVEKKSLQEKQDRVPEKNNGTDKSSKKRPRTEAQ